MTFIVSSSYQFAFVCSAADGQGWDVDLVDYPEAAVKEEQPSTSSNGLISSSRSEPEKWNPSRIEIICSTISSFAESYCLPERDVKSSKYVRNMFELLKREFKFLRSFWRCLTDRVSAHDELRMATERIRLLTKDEDPKILSQAPTNILHPHMVIGSFKVCHVQFTSRSSCAFNI